MVSGPFEHMSRTFDFGGDEKVYTKKRTAPMVAVQFRSHCRTQPRSSAYLHHETCKADCIARHIPLNAHNRATDLLSSQTMTSYYIFKSSTPQPLSSSPGLGQTVQCKYFHTLVTAALVQGSTPPIFDFSTHTSFVLVVTRCRRYGSIAQILGWELRIKTHFKQLIERSVQSKPPRMALWARMMAKREILLGSRRLHRSHYQRQRLCRRLNVFLC